jgi:hypothetical protein
VRGNVLDALAVDLDAEVKAGDGTHAQRAQGAVSANDDLVLAIAHEYPVAGCDSYGAVAEDVEPYTTAYEASSPIAEPSEQTNAPAEQAPGAQPSESVVAGGCSVDMSEKRSDG